jgi:hypothetical protein
VLQHRNRKRFTTENEAGPHTFDRRVIFEQPVPVQQLVLVIFSTKVSLALGARSFGFCICHALVCSYVLVQQENNLCEIFSTACACRTAR